MAKCEILSQFDVPVPGHQYPILFCTHALNDSTLLEQFITSGQVLIVTNEVVAPYYLQQVQEACAARQCDTVIIPDGEQYKNQTSITLIYDALIQNKHHRDTTLIALGGGVIGDMVGFAASTYQRGVSCIQIPTTLLAQIDSAVGGKTAINHSVAKNMIGTFYQPKAVIADISTLVSLPEREFRAGLGEMIKYGILEGGDFLKKLLYALEEGIRPQSDGLSALIQHCCAIKARFVVDDEREQGSRALLNLGHTFAHALEASTGYRVWLHGEAVAIGLYCAALLSHQLGVLDTSDVLLVAELLDNAGLPRFIPKSVHLDTLMELMKLDKKIKNNQLQFVVFKDFGACYLDRSVPEHVLYNALRLAVEGN